MQRVPPRKLLSHSNAPNASGVAGRGLGSHVARALEGVLSVVRGVVGVVLGIAVSLTVAVFAVALGVAGMIFAAVFRRKLRKAMERAVREGGSLSGEGPAGDAEGSIGAGGWRRFGGPGGIVGFYSVGGGPFASRESEGDPADSTGDSADASSAAFGPRGAEAIEVLDVEAEVLDPPRRSK